MGARSIGAAVLLWAVVAAGCTGAAPVTPESTASARSAAVPPAVRRVCGAPLPGHRACEALLRTDAAPSFAAPACAGAPPYCASDLQSAYGAVAAAVDGGRGVTVAIVDAFGYPSAASDLAAYRDAMGLPPCAPGNGCFRVVNQRGAAAPLPGVNAIEDWRFEEALDIDMVSALCPNCRILLVQASSSRIGDLDRSVDAAVALGAAVVSNSYGGPEMARSDAAFDRPGHAIVASAGDGGAGAEQPCSFAGVVCVGGTTLRRAGNARGWSETAWGGTGSGCSARVAKPAWQHDPGCGGRSEADLAAEADPVTPVAVYLDGGWVPMGGTSAGSPMIAAMLALAGNVATIDAPAYVWQHGGTAAFHDVVQGSNPGRFHCSKIMRYLCNAGPGYDGPTGWGTPDGLAGL